MKGMGTEEHPRPTGALASELDGRLDPLGT